ncbi:MAG: conjugal transfer protein TraI [Umezawaea sp.]
MTATAEHFDGPGDHDDEITRGLHALTAHLAAAAPPVVEPAPSVPVAESKRVKARRAEHAEAAQLLELDEDETPFLVESDAVRAKRKKVRRAAQLHQLDSDPTALAYRDARVRRLIVTLGLVALSLALAWSTAGVQHFAAEGAAPWSPGWVFAWLVEPFCSLALLMVVGGRAYLTTRGRPLHNPTVERTEWVFLGLTLGMNAWPHLPLVAVEFRFSALVLHVLGPIIAVAVVRCLPPLLAAFSALGSTGGTGPSCSANNTEIDSEPRPEVAALATRVRSLIASGDLRADAGAKPIRRALRCSMALATEVRNELNRTTR